MMFPHHTVVLYRCATNDIEVCFDGGAPLRGSAAEGVLSIHPAGLRYEARRLRKMGERRQLVALGLTSEFVASVAGTQRYELIPSFVKEDMLAHQIVATLTREVDHGEGIDSLYSQSLLVALAAHLTRRHARPAKGRIDGLRAFIADRLDQPLTLEDLAAFSQCDVRSFTRWFRSEVGVSPHRYVTQARVERARSLIAKTNRPLSEIALECGFSSQSHLTTVFRRFTGHTPGRFRKT
jgi:AraC family transcriptional regulator